VIPIAPGLSSGMAQRRLLVTLAPDHAAAWLVLATGLGGGAASVPALERAARLPPGSAEAHHARRLRSPHTKARPFSAQAHATALSV
jgi:hypothetical protein